MERFQLQFNALGSAILLTIVHSRRATADATLAAARQRIMAFEQRFSRFKDTSELTTFNRSAGERTAITATFRTLLQAAQDYAEKTNGLYNPFTLPRLQQAGYRGSWPHPEITTAGTDFSHRHLVTADRLIIGDTWAQIPPDSALDFGGIGKGYLLDELAAWLRPQAYAGYWLSLGGDILCSGHDIENNPWQIGVQDAQDPTRAVATITNYTGGELAIATSGVTKRRGDGWHHIIDPRTGLPARTDLLTATVTASSGIMADIAAKTIIIAGTKQAERYKAAGDIAGYILQADAGRLIIHIQGA